MNRDERTAHDAADSRASEGEAKDPLRAWDDERRRCPVTRETGEQGETRWLVHGHPEALQVLLDPATFSSRVSAHLSVPSGMDPPEHGPYRAIVEKYFGPSEVGAFEPACRRVAAVVIEGALERRTCELRVFTEELLDRGGELSLDPARAAVFAVAPKGGYERVYARLGRPT